MFQIKAVERTKTHILCSITFPFPPPSLENRAIYEIMWKNVVEPERTQMTIKCGAEKMRFPCRITKARTHIHTHSQYLRLIAS